MSTRANLTRSVTLLLAVACASVLEDNTPYVTTPRVLAVRVEPAEVLAGEEVHLTALYADATGALTTAPLDWSFCVTPKPLAELGPVASSCLTPGSEDLAEVGSGIDVTGLVPTDACSLFGPNPPPPVDGAAAGRPADPDVTGGFYQPVIAFAGDGAEGNATFAQVRVRCGLANVSQETYIAWNTSYRSNERPSVASVALVRGADETPIAADGTGAVSVTAREEVSFKVSWPECPSAGVCGDGVCSSDEDVTICEADCAAPVGCRGAESYVVYNPETGLLDPRREGISATWFATGGILDVARNGRSGDESELDVTNVWTAPAEPGEVWVAVALRDERGGVEFASFRVNVTP